MRVADTGGGPNGAAVGPDGKLYVCNNGAISVVSPTGKLLEQVKVPKWDIFVTNICFGGPELRTASITSSGHGLLYEMPWPRSGLRLNANA